MSFDEDPKDTYENYPCPRCGGEVRFSETLDKWFCVEDKCDFTYRKEERKTK